jgi:nucleotide-binding universal stress UspA family protein
VILNNAVPLLVLREVSDIPENVLLVDDGTHSSSRSIKSFLSSGLFQDSTIRLLSVAATAHAAEKQLGETIENLQVGLSDLETDYIVGKPADVIPWYARKTKSELIVLGVNQKPAWQRLLFGETLVNILKQTNCAFYCTN